MMEPLDYLKKIEEAGFECYIVGGYVRDSILGIHTTDVDITTNAKPKDISKIFGVNLNEKLGCVNIKKSNLNVDITTFRRESNYFNRHPKKISYVDDVRIDLNRRDFTINAICMNKDGDLFDPLNGVEDLNNKTIRVIGNIKKKFTEDPLRIFRALRLSIIYDFRIEEDALIFILNNKNLLKAISYERKKGEIDKIIVSDNAEKGLEMLTNLGLLDALEITYNKAFKPTKDLMGAWAQLEFSSNYHFSKVESMRLNKIKSILKEGKIDEFVIYENGIYDVLVASEIMGVDSELAMKKYKDMPLHSASDLLIKGDQIKNLLGIEAGPVIRDIKKDLIMQVLSGNLPNSEEDLSNYVLKNWK